MKTNNIPSSMSRRGMQFRDDYEYISISIRDIGDSDSSWKTLSFRFIIFAR